MPLSNKDSTRVLEFFDKPIYLAGQWNIAIRTKMVRELIGTLQNCSILDIGCGDGALSLPYAQNNKLVLLDISVEMIAAARRNIEKLGCAGVKLIHGDFSLSQFEETFNYIMYVGVFAHDRSPWQSIEKISALLVPGGHLVVQISDNEHPRYRQERIDDSAYGYQLNRIAKRAFVLRLEKYGFRLVCERSYSWLPRSLRRIPLRGQIAFIDWARRRAPLSFMNSEYILLMEKKH